MGNATLQRVINWKFAVCAIVSSQILLCVLLPRGFALTASGDLIQSLLLLLATFATFSNLRTSYKKAKFFWALLGLGCAMWFCSQLVWTYFEVVLRHDTPNPFAGDVVLFLHIVPLMAAVAVQPHLQQDERARRMGSLDFLLLLTCWLYLYLFIVIPWQYVYPAAATYGRAFDVLYACEQLVLVFALFLVWRRSRGSWRVVYAHLAGAALLYSMGSIGASEAIDYGAYYTGSLYDVPLVAAMAWFAAIGFMAHEISSVHPMEEVPADGHGIWKARLAMLAVFFTPLMVAWAQFSGNAPQRVRTYRLLLTVAVMIVMGTLVFLKQHLLDRELLSLLQASGQHLNETCRLKDELENKEHSLRWHSLELQRKNLELQEISFTDSLTGVWNRRYLEEILTSEAGQVLRNYQRAHGTDIRRVDHRDLVFMMVDVDFFKQVNDQYGHPAGDRLLQLVAERLASVVRKSDVLVRWGGEEFLIMNRSTDPSGTPAFCSRILEVMARAPFELGHGIAVRKTCSVGWAPYPWARDAFEAISAEEVIALADTALYRAKAQGRNCGVGLLPSDAASSAPSIIKLRSSNEDWNRLTRVIVTECPAAVSLSETAMHMPEPAL